jgi:hypothetical protein
MISLELLVTVIVRLTSDMNDMTRRHDAGERVDLVLMESMLDRAVRLKSALRLHLEAPYAP